MRIRETNPNRDSSLTDDWGQRLRRFAGCLTKLSVHILALGLLERLARSSLAKTGVVMRKELAEKSSIVFLRRVLELWPYLFIAISVGGFAYIAVSSGR